jgi:hypothetical protein
MHAHDEEHGRLGIDTVRVSKKKRNRNKEHQLYLSGIVVALGNFVKNSSPPCGTLAEAIIYCNVAG